ncbi:hypothetical protein PMAYCL1PPCAC_25761, partial [Pristionchus mayeri]
VCQHLPSVRCPSQYALPDEENQGHEAGEYPAPMAPSLCKPLEELACPAPATACDHNQLVYTPYKTDEWRVTCKTGMLVTDISMTPTDFFVENCSAQGQWGQLNPATKATCVTDESGYASCLTLLGGSPSDYKVSCKLGACIITCVDATKQLEYEYFDGGLKTEKKDKMKCDVGEPKTFNLEPIYNPKGCV